MTATLNPPLSFLNDQLPSFLNNSAVIILQIIGNFPKLIKKCSEDFLLNVVLVQFLGIVSHSSLLFPWCLTSCRNLDLAQKIIAGEKSIFMMLIKISVLITVVDSIFKKAK